eukprot:765875-Hanusia_phi.AAC.2
MYTRSPSAQGPGSHQPLAYTPRPSPPHRSCRVPGDRARRRQSRERCIPRPSWRISRSTPPSLDDSSEPSRPRPLCVAASRYRVL